eukprot:TRINITY_DN73396_c0_g1_i1.p1 TRINITY_DN73396_c0_g1~~TRINITY_DN73396_c0_g1_i1.p1  ORF type:complete len:511 (-),score=77.43 TRINITY_DN73396_c0_g1_i1:318-1811(-)
MRRAAQLSVSVRGLRSVLGGRCCAGAAVAAAKEEAGPAAVAAAAPPGKRPALRLAPRKSQGRGGDARVARHVPWIFRNEAANVEELRGLGHPALLVDVTNSEGIELGAAVCNLQKGGTGAVNIFARMLANNANLEIDTDFFAERIRAALQHRQRSFGADETHYRLLHAEGDLLPGVTCDRFGSTLCLQFTSAAMEQLFEQEVVQALREVVEPECIIIRSDKERDRQLELAPMRAPRVAFGSYSAPTHLPGEGAFNFSVDLTAEGLAMGRYFEERRLRTVLKSLLGSPPSASLNPSSIDGDGIADKTNGAGVCQTPLNVLSFFGESLGVFCAAISGDARVTYIDAGSLREDEENCSRKSIEALASSNGLGQHLSFADISGAPGPHALSVTHRGAYEVVLLEPPPFAPTYGTLEEGSQLYSTWAAAAATAASPGGLLVVVCRSRAMNDLRLLRSVNLGIWSAGRKAELIERWSGCAPDFPIHLGLPDTQALRVLVMRVR